MPITEVVSNAETLTLTLIGEYAVPVTRLWDAYADPKQIERFWGPEGWPATFLRHDMAVGGESRYYMTGPDGTRAHGWFRFLAVEPHTRIVVEDGFSDANGAPDANMPTMRMTFGFEATPNGSRSKVVTQFHSVDAMRKVLDLGMMEGMRSAMGQLDTLLTDLKAFATSLATDAQLLSDTEVRISRVIRGTVEQVWRAHHDASLMKRWLLGPEGWTMPVCQVADKIGDSYRYEWAKDDGTERFGFEGEVLESSAPYREVTSERMIGMDGPGTTNALTLVPVKDGTLLSLLITYPNKEMRDMILGTGMTQGMETSYARLESVLAAAADPRT